MAKVCQLTGKKTLIGKTRKHKHSEGWKFRATAKRRVWKPNLRTAKIVVDGARRSVTVSMKAYKKLTKEGQIAR